LANLLRSLALPDTLAKWSLATLREKLVKINVPDACIKGRYVAFPLAKVAVPTSLFAETLRRIGRLRGSAVGASPVGPDAQDASRRPAGQSGAGLAAQGLAAADVIALEQAIYGQVVVPGDADYAEANRQANPAFVRRPRLVVHCETPGDVKQSLGFARRLGLAVRCRSGGHSTAGFSAADGCMVIDTSRMQYVHLSGDAPAPIADVGAGSEWGYVNSVLDSYDLHVPGGGCESVCVAGFMQGGGYGYTSRMYGMSCDNVAAVKVMLADGRIVIADERQNAPLFWAARGGTGGNFGVLLETSYRLQRPGPLWGFGLRWRIEDAPRAILAIQDGYMKTNSSRLIGCETHGTTVDGRQMLMMRGIYRGGRAEALQALQPALATPGAQLEYGFEASYLELNRRHEQGVSGSVPSDAKEDKQSGYLRAPPSLSEWEGLIDLFTRTPNPYSVFNLEARGAAINDFPAGGTAFVTATPIAISFWMSIGPRSPSARTPSGSSTSSWPGCSAISTGPTAGRRQTRTIRVRPRPTIWTSISRASSGTW
jgi:hypothetical protein